MYCSECGREIPNDSLFCQECGAKQEPVQQPQFAQRPGRNQNSGGYVKVCPNCGCQMPSDSRFCPECRTRQEGVPSVKAGSRTQPGGRRLAPEEEARLKKRDKMVGMFVAAALVSCVIIIVLSSIIKPSIKLNKYITISFEGYDTVGQAEAVFDMERFAADYEKKLSKAAGKKGSGALSFLSNCVHGALDKNSGLSNGDVVTYSWNCDDDTALAAYGYKLKYEDIKVTVADLREAGIFDPFDGIGVEFDGIGPNGSAYIIGGPTATAAQELRYELDKSSGLSNGDTVTVTASMYYDDPTEYCIRNYGMLPASLTKTFPVEGLAAYVKTLSEISDESLEEMKAQAADVYSADVAKNWGGEETLKSFTYIGNYLLVNKNSDDYWGTNNVLYLVYKAQVKDEYSFDGQTYNETNDIYWYICYYNLLVYPDGATTVDVTGYHTPDDRFTVDSGISNGWWSTKTWNYYGYQTLDELYKAVVVSNAETFKHEDNVDESLAPVSEAVEEEPGGTEGIIFPASSEVEINSEEIAALSDEDLKYAINEIYARRGYIFKDDELRSYYGQFDWYVQSVAPDDFSMELFNEAEKKNVEALQKEREGRN